MGRILIVLFITLSCFSANVIAEELYEYLYNEILKKHVVTGKIDGVKLHRVDYEALMESQNFRTIIRGLEKFDPDRLKSRDAELAFWINVYNIAAINLILEHYPVNSIKDIGYFLKPVWHINAITINGEPYTLSQIEHDILRGYDEPRIHFAIVCASVSCPDLRKEAYTEAKIDSQLDEQTKTFLANKTKGARYDKQFGIVSVSRLFKWFKADFMVPIPDYIEKHTKIKAKKKKLQFLPYNWKLNDL